MTRQQRQTTLARQATELLMATPQVVAHRMGRMASAGFSPSARDQQEFQRMGAEKLAAFQESWMAMGLHAFAMQQQMGRATLALWTGWIRAAARPTAAGAAVDASRALHHGFWSWHDMAVGVAGKGLAPVHRRAVANARRLRGR